MRYTGLVVLLGAGLMVLGLMMPVTSFAQEVEAAVDPTASRYIDLKPAFVVNYGGAGRLRYLKAEVALRVSGGIAGPSDVRHHMPYIRHALVMELSRASEEDLSSMEGRELLRQEALEAVRRVLMQEAGRQFVDDLLFSAFIVQR